jgi:nickel transport system substrate-binding protein
MVGGGVNNGGTASGTGRWKYVKTEYDEQDPESIKSIHFAINEDHWDASSGRNGVKELVLVHYPTHEEVKAALLDGSLDTVLGSGVLTEAEIADLKRNHTEEVFVSLTEPIMNRIIVMNTAKTPTDDLQNRKVIIHAVDKTAIIEKELAGLDEPAISLFPKNSPYSGAHLTPVPDYDLEKAMLLNCAIA